MKINRRVHINNKTFWFALILVLLLAQTVQMYSELRSK